MDGSLDKYSLNEHLFRRVPEGWLITTPVLWPIGGRVYLLSEAQKAQLAACLERWQPRIDTMSSWVNAPVLLFIIVSQLTHYDLVGALSEHCWSPALSQMTAILFFCSSSRAFLLLLQPSYWRRRFF